MCDSCEAYACEIASLEMQLEDIARLEKQYEWYCMHGCEDSIDREYWDCRRSEILKGKSLEEIERRIAHLRYLLSH